MSSDAGWRRLDNPIPSGTRWTAMGVATAGLCSYAFLALAARHLGAHRYAPLAAFWSVTFLVGPGCYGVLEREVGRHVASGLARRDRAAPVAARCLVVGGVLALVLVAASIGASALLRHTFDGNAVLVAAFVLSLVTFFVQFFALGLAAGNSLFGPYGVVVGGEGLARLLAAGALAILGITAVGPYGMAIGLAPLLSVVPVARRLRRAEWSGPDISMRDLARSGSWILVSLLLSNVIVSVGPILVKVLAGPGQAYLTAPFLSALVLVRVPLFLYNAAAATLLPSLAGHAAVGDWSSFDRAVRRLVVIVAVVGVTVVLAAALAGPAVLRLVFGPGFSLPARDLAVLAATAAELILATTLAAALNAAGWVRELAMSWAFGVLVMAVIVAVGGGLLARVEWGLLGGALGSVAGMVVGLSRIDAGAAVGARREPETWPAPIALDRSVGAAVEPVP